MANVCYTDIDANACAWMGELVQQGHLAPGPVLPYDIKHITPEDVEGYDRVHFFAGIGGWELACRLAGWPDELRLWTASLPCQPWSVAGAGKGVEDERHLWPVFRDLVAQCLPDRVVGEQVASKAGRAWLDALSVEMEDLGYAVGAVDLSASCVGAPHIRQRLFWVAERVADTGGAVHRGQTAPADHQRAQDHGPADKSGRCGGASGGVANTPSRGQRADGSAPGRTGHDDQCGAVGGLDDTASPRHEWSEQDAEGEARDETRLRVSSAGCEPCRPSQDHSGWSSPDWLYCRDGKWRPVEPGTFPLASRLPRGMGRMRAALGRLGLRAKDIARVLKQPSAIIAGAGANRTTRLRGYGNAIVPQVAAEFLAAYLETLALPRNQ